MSLSTAPRETKATITQNKPRGYSQSPTIGVEHDWRGSGGGSIACHAHTSTNTTHPSRQPAAPPADCATRRQTAINQTNARPFLAAEVTDRSPSPAHCIHISRTTQKQGKRPRGTAAAWKLHVQPTRSPQQRERRRCRREKGPLSITSTRTTQHHAKASKRMAAAPREHLPADMK